MTGEVCFCFLPNGRFGISADELNASRLMGNISAPEKCFWGGFLEALAFEEGGSGVGPGTIIPIAYESFYRDLFWAIEP